jgi:hypothetical protein
MTKETAAPAKDYLCSAAPPEDHTSLLLLHKTRYSASTYYLPPTTIKVFVQRAIHLHILNYITSHSSKWCREYSAWAFVASR